MMSHELTCLRCPQCGNPHNDVEREHAFGAEIHCAACGTTSVLIIHRHLHSMKPGQNVCKACGRVVLAKAEFCQCQRKLKKACPNCQQKFFVDDHICPNCRWNDDPNLGSEGVMNRLAVQLNNLLDEHRYEEYAPLEQDLLASVAVRGAISLDAEKSLKRLALGQHERGEGRSFLGRWSHLDGLAQFSPWLKLVDELYEKRRELIAEIREIRKSGGRNDVDGATRPLSRGTGCLILLGFPAVCVFLEDVPGMGPILEGLEGLAPFLVFLCVLYWFRIENYEKGVRLKNCRVKLNELELKRAEWLQEFNVPLVLTSRFLNKKAG